MFNALLFKTALLQRGMKQWQVANQVGCAQSTFSQYTRGVKPFPPGMLPKVERILGVKRGALEAPSPAPRRHSPAPRRAAGVK